MTAEIYAIRYARHDRGAAENFLDSDPHEGPMPLDYFVWAIVQGPRAIVVDTGFGAEQARRRGRELLRSPADGLSALGIDPERVEDVVVTHMHYDHAGNLDLFPNARFHLQGRELAYTTGRLMAHPHLRHSFVAADAARMVGLVYEGRIVFHDGDDALAPGVSLHLVGGHTAGLQAVRVETRRGAVVLASDAAHLYRHLEERRGFPVVLDAAAMMAGHERLRALAASDSHIVPGHDPLVMRRYPAASPALADVAVRLDSVPLAPRNG